MVSNCYPLQILMHWIHIFIYRYINQIRFFGKINQSLWELLPFLQLKFCLKNGFRKINCIGFIFYTQVYNHKIYVSFDLNYVKFTNYYGSYSPFSTSLSLSFFFFFFGKMLDSRLYWRPVVAVFLLHFYIL